MNKKKTRNISIKSDLSRFYKDVEVFFHEILVRAIIAYQWKERLVCSLKKIYVSKFATKQKKKEAYLQFKCKSHVIVEYLPVLPTVINIFYVSENSKLREINFGKLLFYSWQDCNLLYLSYFDVIGIWKFYVNTYFQGMISVIFWN